MASEMKDEIVIVTGASGMIGSACAKAFISRGAKVVGTGIEEQAPHDTLGDLSAHPDFRYLQLDLTSDEQIDALMREANEAFGTPTVLVNNAAVYNGHTPIFDITRLQLERVFGINVFGPLLLAQKIAAQMVKKNIAGSIVNLTSTSSQQSDPLSIHYDTSKGAVDAATRGLAVALGRYGIRVNAVGPGEMIKAQERPEIRSPTDLTDFEKKRIPLGRLATPEEVANAVAFLASSASTGISGSIVWVDGGTLGTWDTSK